MQQFAGEDLMREERMRQQKAAQASWCEQQKFEISQMQRDQATMNAEKRAQEAAEAKAFERQSELMRKQLVGMERQKQQARRAAMEKVRQENMQLKAEQAQKKDR